MIVFLKVKQRRRLGQIQKCIVFLPGSLSPLVTKDG